MDTKNCVKEVKGVKISNFNTCTVIVVCILMFGLLTATFLLARKYEALIVSTGDYISLEKQADVVEDASDYLTEQVMLFVQTMDIKHVDLYFEEADVTRRREHALSKLENSGLAGSWERHLEQAVWYSNELMEQEIYAMKLVVSANDYEIHSLPEKLQEMQLESEDAALDSAAMIEKARMLVFSEEYQHRKAVIYEHLDQFTNGILFSIENRIEVEADSLSGVMLLQRMLLFVLTAMIILMFVAIAVLVIRPLRIYLKCIEEKTMLEYAGSYEFKRIAEGYNDVYSHQVAK